MPHPALRALLWDSMLVHECKITLFATVSHCEAVEAFPHHHHSLPLNHPHSNRKTLCRSWTFLTSVSISAAAAGLLCNLLLRLSNARLFATESFFDNASVVLPAESRNSSVTLPGGMCSMVPSNSSERRNHQQCFPFFINLFRPPHFNDVFLLVACSSSRLFLTMCIRFQLVAETCQVRRGCSATSRSRALTRHLPHQYGPNCICEEWICDIQDPATGTKCANTAQHASCSKPHSCIEFSLQNR